MKKLSTLITEAKTTGITAQDGASAFISKDKLQEYLKVANKFLSEPAKNVINWLITNNGTYMKTIGGIEKFYNAGKPKDKNLQELFKWIGMCVKKGEQLQIPTLLNEEVFEKILKSEISLDEIVLDLNTEAGRNAVAKKYSKLVYKIAHSFNGKSTLSFEELTSAGYKGLVDAMNLYGKNNVETKKKKNADKSDDELDSLIDQENAKARKAFTFLSYASYLIRICILEAIKNESHLVRIPVSQQNKERKETGRNTKSNSISGDKAIGHDSDGKGKTMFDFMDAEEDADVNLDRQDINKLWKGVQDILNKSFDEQTLNIFYHFYGIFGNEKMSAKELMAKYKLKNPSNITTSNYKVFNKIQKDKVLRNAFAELWQLYKECLNDEDRRNADTEPIHISEENYEDRTSDIFSF